VISKPLPSDDLEAVMGEARASFAALAGARIFVTGGTGFFGHWLLESLLWANGELGLDVHATVLTRDAAGFRRGSPWIAEDAAITLLEGDIRSFEFPAVAHTHFVHGATDSGKEQQDVLGTMASVVEGTKRAFACARAMGAARLLNVSTGAVYGRSTTMEHTPETFPIPPLQPGSYEASKRMAETYLLNGSGSTAVVIARPFAFVGPRLPLDAHFAIGNFIGSALRGETLRVSSDGTPRRSWMYMSDLAAWLWTLLVRGENGRAYNVGSDEGYTIAEAARLTAATLAPELSIEIAEAASAGAALNSYVPSVERAKGELGLRVKVPLDEALRRTAAWYR
jgi:UDP-glucuronate decarboxylase